MWHEYHVSRTATQKGMEHDDHYLDIREVLTSRMIDNIQHDAFSLSPTLRHILTASYVLD